MEYYCAGECAGFVPLPSVLDFLQLVSPCLNCWRHLHVLHGVVLTCLALAWVLSQWGLLNWSGKLHFLCEGPPRHQE